MFNHASDDWQLRRCIAGACEEGSIQWTEHDVPCKRMRSGWKRGENRVGDCEYLTTQTWHVSGRRGLGGQVSMIALCHNNN
jgi:hypothetical protein